MKISTQGRLRHGIYLTFIAGTLGATIAPMAVHADDNDVKLQGVQVTGSHIRRVDTETEDPVITLGHQFLQSTGANTLGELIYQLPNMAGGSMTPQINNGGDGETAPGLRGLTAARTLVLLDGERLLLTNIDAIPINMIDHVEIVKDGASAVYGTDAIGGVINIITRKRFSGFEATVSGGISGEGDGSKDQFTGTWGLSSPKGHVVTGVSYSSQAAVSTAKRNFSNQSFYQGYNGAQLAGGSGTGTNGRYFVPLANEPTGLNCGTGATVEVALNNPSTGAPQNNSSYFHCFNKTPGYTDTFNYNLYNYIQLPEQRVELFGMGDYKLFDDVSWVFQGLFHSQNATTQLAPEPLVVGQAPFDTTVVSAQNYYNPFGVDLSQARLRLASAGNRTSAYDTEDYNLQTGLKGELLDRFSWDVLFTYQRETLLSTYQGALYVPGMQAALGPSIDQNTCGTATSGPIPNCTPFNIFGLPTAAQTASLFPTDFTNQIENQTLINADISGDLFKWWGGTVGGALGYAYRSERLAFTPDYNIDNDLITDFGGATPTGGFDSSNEFYGEISIPLAPRMPGIYSLNTDIGVRYSDYDAFGSTTNAKYGLEYRPIHDLLLRFSYADVYRVPTILDLFGGNGSNATNVEDPCDSPNGTAPITNPACVGIPSGGAAGFADPSDGQFTVTTTSNANLTPEKGYTSNLGLVYNPEFYKPITLSVDLWNYTIKNAISYFPLQTSLNLCYAGESAYCSNFTRDSNGFLDSGLEPINNLGFIQTSGIDVGLKYDIGHTRFGSFNATVDGTYLKKYLYQASNLSPVVSMAGQFLPGAVTDEDGAGNFARYRMLASLTWNFHDFTGTIINRYISNVIEFPGENADGEGPAYYLCADRGPGSQGTLSEAGGSVVCSRNVGAIDYTDLTASYSIPRLKTELLVGVNNLFNQQPPLIYSGFNANTDSSTYDQLGRAFFGRIKVSFK